MANEYSANWFKLFLKPIDAAQTAREITFIEKVLPLREYRDVLDLCCGEGRHCVPLTERGYQMTGLDRSGEAIAAARERCPSGTFVQGDMFELSGFERVFDGVLNLWQSFGYFDEAENTKLLLDIRKILRPGGRLVLDVYHRGFFANNQGTRVFEKDGRKISETKIVRDGRLFVELDYGSDAPPDRFDWQIYTPEELCEVAEAIGFLPMHVCSKFEVEIPADPSMPRMQLVLEARH